MFRRVWWVWMRRRIARVVGHTLAEGTGITTAHWPRQTSTKAVLTWVDEQLATSRTPYGLSSVNIQVFRATAPAQPWNAWFLPERRLWWLTVRDEVAMTLDRLLAREDVTIVVTLFGTALDAAWKNHHR